MARHCKGPDHTYERFGQSIRVSCELPPGHDGPHAAWTWEMPPHPRVEWENDDRTQLRRQPHGGEK
jgi:hypothetical protein